MGKKKNIVLGILVGLVLVGCTSMGRRIIYHNTEQKLGKVQKILYLQPDIFPYVEEIKLPTNQAFSAAMEENAYLYNHIKTIAIDHSMVYDDIDNEYIVELLENNNADAIIIPKVKYFKVGFGKYVFSNQVLVSLKLYNAEGNLLMETEYDTYKANARLIGKAENSIKIGTKGALKELIKGVKRQK